MSTQDAGTPTPQKVEQLATQAVQLDRLALIGISGTQGAPRALIRMPQGDTQTVKVGDTIRGGIIEAIDADQLVLSRNGTQQVMRMPRG